MGRLVAVGMIFLLTFTMFSMLNVKASSQRISSNAPSDINRLTQTALNETEFQKYHTSDEVISILQALKSAFPILMNASIIGQSYEGKEIWAAEITNFQTGPPSTKPAMLYLGPHHGNEMIGKEISLYYLWYLLTNYGVNQTITQLLDEKTVYVIPCVNVDGNDWTIKGLAQRYNSRPVDDDGDGLLDEDSNVDLNGDGKITDMRRWNETLNDWDYILYGEGIDHDGDGFVGEDPSGGIDLNRNYPKGWANYTGGGEYPFSEPETQTVRDFVISHPNIATVFDTHSGAMCLIYPWAYTGTLPPDNQLYTTLKTKYEQLTGYAYHRIGAQGTSDDWIYSNQSAICFVMELFGQGFYPGGPAQFWEDYPDAEVPWQNFTHPAFGEVQIGGGWIIRFYNPPEAEIEIFARKVLPMLLDLVEITPKLEITQVRALQQFGAGKTGLFNVSATIANSGFLDTATLQALQTHTNMPVNVTLSFSGNVELLSGNQTVAFPVIKGNQTANTQWQVKIAQGSDAWVEVTAISAKGGIDATQVYLNLPKITPIFIKEDGTIDPESAPIKNEGNTIYIVTDDVANASIIVERSNITIDGNGHILEGPFNSSEWSVGLNLTQNSLNNVTIRNFNIIGFSEGVDVYHGKNIIIYANNMTENALNAIELQETSNSIIFGNRLAESHTGININSTKDSVLTRNDITNNDFGVCLVGSSNNNKLYHNNFINNSQQVSGFASTNTWDNGYPSGGNYWSNYTGWDYYYGSNQDLTGSDGVGDIAHILYANNTDHYPLTGPFKTFNVGIWNNASYNVDVVSKSTVTNLNFKPYATPRPTLNFDVEGENGTNGFSRVVIPRALMWCNDTSQWVITVSGTLTAAESIIEDGNYTYICFTYTHSTKTVQIQSTHAVPEFQSLVFLLLFMIMALVMVVIVFKRKRKVRT